MLISQCDMTWNQVNIRFLMEDATYGWMRGGGGGEWGFRPDISDSKREITECQST